MTISTTTSRAQYNGNGVTTVFSFPYLFLANGDLEVRLIEASGASTVLTLTTDYTVTGADNDAGGSVTMLVAPATGEQLLIRRIVDLTQETAYPSGGDFPAKSHERALDKLTMLVQQHDEELARTLQLPPESDVDASTINVEAVEVVAGIAADVEAVAAIDEQIEDVVDNLAAILDAPAQASAAAASALAADASADAAAASAAAIALPLATTSGGSGSSYADAAALFNGVKQNATTTATGVVELATSAEVATGTDTTRAITPAALRGGPIQSMVRVNTQNGYGSTNTVIRRFSTIVSTAGSDITYADSASLGGSFTINNAGVYAISYTDNFGGIANMGLSLNSTQLTTDILSITAADRITETSTGAANQRACCGLSIYLTAGSVIRAHTNGGTAGSLTALTQFTITRVA